MGGGGNRRAGSGGGGRDLDWPACLNRNGIPPMPVAPPRELADSGLWMDQPDTVAAVRGVLDDDDMVYSENRD